VCEFSWFITNVTWVGEINAPLAIQANVIGSVVLFAIEVVGQCRPLFRLHVPARNPAATEPRALTGQQLSRRIEDQSVGLAAVIGEDRRLFRFGIET
jgi:hypothetical protein